MPERVRQVIADVGEAEQLIRFAAAAQLARLDDEEHISQRVVAQAMGRPDAAFLSRLLRTGHFTDKQLRELDEVIVALAPQMPGAGTLSSLNIRLRGLTHRDALVAQVPCSWTWELLADPPVTEFDVLTQSSALLSIFMILSKAKRRVGDTRNRAAGKLTGLVNQLILIGCTPPTARNTDALVILGSLAKYSLRETSDLIKDALVSQPLGFRVWRAVTNLVQLTKNETDEQVEKWVTDLFKEAASLREKSTYPGRSLDLELAITIPGEWTSRAEEDWVRAFLLSRARDPNATIRERGTAAHGLWERAFFDAKSLTTAKGDLQELIAIFRSEAETHESAAGLRWIAATLGAILEGRPQTRFCNTWPPCEDPWFQAVRRAAEGLDEADIPVHLQSAFKTLFEHSLLQNAGVARRQAIDALVASGCTQPIVNALDSVLRSEDSESWLRSRALFALGFLQQRDGEVATVLADACRSAYTRYVSRSSEALAAELHSALFAVGDCFGVGFQAGEENSATRTIRRIKDDILRPLVHEEKMQHVSSWPVARAAVYMLTFTAEATRPSDSSSSRELLKILTSHPDAVTRSFSAWALAFRFAADGGVRPILGT
ncbi:hypothetical protein [Streptomyces albogriseolus]|uniref:hypothetical protein n=1 Tax=Streptomyces albogriseolus TaxID=1887 RepID=UPI0036800C36